MTSLRGVRRGWHKASPAGVPSGAQPLETVGPLQSAVNPAGRLPGFADFCLVPVLYFLGAKVGVWLTVVPEGTAILWPPNSVLLAVLLLFQGRHLITFSALAVAAEVAADIPTFTVIEALLFGLTNVMEATVIFSLLTRWGFDSRFRVLEDLPKFVIAGPIVGAFLAACMGALIYSHFRGGETGYAEFLRIWWFGDALGLIIFTPALLGLWPTGAADRDVRGAGALRPADGIVAAGALAAVGALMASQGGVLRGVHVSPLILLPFVLFAAARFTLRWSSLSVAAAALVIVTLVTSGRNPFGTLSPAETVLHTQEFLFLMSVMALGLSGLLSQVRSKQEQIETTNRRLSELNHALEVRVGERTRELQTLNTELQRLALTDALTGLPNRRAFLELAYREFARSKRHGRPLLVAFCDLDHFKAVNDRYGHQAGDAVLQQVAMAISSRIRASAAVARYGGEEFVFLVPETTLAGGVELMERIRHTLRCQDLHAANSVLRVTASFGTTMLRADDKSVDELLRRADRALYAAKAQGRDRVVVADAD